MTPLFSIKKDKKLKKNEKEEDEALSRKLHDNLEKIKQIFEYPLNKDFNIREVKVKFLDIKGYLLYMDGVVNKSQIEQHIIKPLLYEKAIEFKNEDLVNIMDRLISALYVSKCTTFLKAKRDIVEGYTVLLLDGYSEAISFGTRKYESRGIEKTQIENVIKGPKESFVESSDLNRGLIRKYVKNEKLIAEKLAIGERSVYDISVLYIKDLADPKLVKVIKKRIKEIQVDGITNLSIL